MRQEGLPKQIVDIAWRAQLRLCRRYQLMSKKGKHDNLIIAAIAREMEAFIWAIVKEVVLTLRGRYDGSGLTSTEPRA